MLCAALVGLIVQACGEDAPRERRDEPRDTKDGGGKPDAGPKYNGRCGGVACPAGVLGRPCCTTPGTGEHGHLLENVGRGANLCGTDLDVLVPALAGICLQLSQPGELDRSCPLQVSLGNGDTRPGCCTDEGFCGSFDPFVPLGCFYATGLKGRRCGPRAPDAGGDDDAGSR